MSFHRLFAKIKALLFPDKCVICSNLTDEGVALCEECYKKYSAERMAKCSRCKMIPSECICRLGDFELLYGGVYRGYNSSSSRVSERLMYKLKRNRNEKLSAFFARELAVSVSRYLVKNHLSAENCVITFPPRSKEGFEKYGFDHMESICEKLSLYTGIRAVCVLNRCGGKEQKTLSAEERLENAINTLSISDGEEITGKTVFLIDDIVTTGATLKSAAELLVGAGAKNVVFTVISKTDRRI